MTSEPAGTTGATVDVGGEGPVRSYAVRLEDGAVPAGRADFIEADGGERTRIFFHTEVDPEFTGRGLAGLLIRTALQGAVEENLLVVPVCPLFAQHLRKHGDAYLAEGGRFRAPRPADLELVRRAVRGATVRD